MPAVCSVGVVCVRMLQEVVVVEARWRAVYVCGLLVRLVASACVDELGRSLSFG